MYKVRVKAHMDILGEIVGAEIIEVNEYTTKKEAKKKAEVIAHEKYCHKYGVPVHFKASSCSNWETK